MKHFFVHSFLLFLFQLFFISAVFSQISTPITPKSSTFSTITTEQHYYSSSSNLQGSVTSYTANPNNNTPGATADDIIAQQNKILLKQMGYSIPVTPPSDPLLLHQFIIDQYNKENTPKTLQQQQEILELLNESYVVQNTKRYSSLFSKSTEYTKLSKPFSDALQTLNDQLTGKTALSLKDAYYTLENAYGDSYIDYDDYSKAIDESAEFIKSWLKNKGYKTTSNEALHLGIQQFMKDTLSISYKNIDLNKTTTLQHLPFIYDYEDFKGEKDYRNYFVTKCIATGTGQCNSLPSTYLLLAEALGANAYLCLAPQHSFVKYPDDNGRTYGYEPTSNYSINDKWYVEHMFISAKAIMNKIYLDTLNKTMIVADCLLQLAKGYISKFGIADTAFLNECINTAVKYFPKKNCITAYFLRSMILARQLEQTMYENGITDLNKIDSIKNAKVIYTALQKNEAIIKTLGYQEMPENLYEELMKEHEFKGTVQKEKNVATKVKRSLFITTTTQN